MAKNNLSSPLDDKRLEIESLVHQGKTKTEIAEIFNVSEASVRRALKRWRVEKEGPGGYSPGVTVQGDEATLISSPAAELADQEALMRERNFDPEEWEVYSATVNEYEGPSKVEGQITKYRQLKIHLRKKKRITLIAPATEPGDYTRPKVVAPTPPKEGNLVAFVGDQQAPYHDRDLHEKFVSWLKENKPAKGILIGDTVDFPDISRHRDNPDKDATMQECINSGYALLKDYVEASPQTEWVKLCGNHDERIRNQLVDNMAKLYNVKRAEIEEEPEASVLSVEHLLRLDRLGIHFIEPRGSYDQTQVQISKYLAARHGWLARKGSGSTALATLEHLGYSVVFGHTHRQSLVHKTTHDISGKEVTTLAGVETGCMCRIEGGLDYAIAPDWQNGFATAQVWQDGKFKIDLATYVDQTLLWRNQRYE